MPIQPRQQCRQHSGQRAAGTAGGGGRSHEPVFIITCVVARLTFFLKPAGLPGQHGKDPPAREGIAGSRTRPRHDGQLLFLRVGLGWFSGINSASTVSKQQRKTRAVWLLERVSKWSWMFEQEYVCAKWLTRRDPCRAWDHGEGDEVGLWRCSLPAAFGWFRPKPRQNPGLPKRTRQRRQWCTREANGWVSGPARPWSGSEDFCGG